jgi:hypothetical protein
LEIGVSDSMVVDELAERLRGYGYAVARTSAHNLHVGLGASRRGAVSVLGSAELELDLYLRAWEATHSGVRVTRLTV